MSESVGIGGKRALERENSRKSEERKIWFRKAFLSNCVESLGGRRRWIVKCVDKKVAIHDDTSDKTAKATRIDNFQPDSAILH